MGRLMADIVLIQFSLLEGWVTLMSHCWQSYQHWATANLELLAQPGLHRRHQVVARGARWTDHYGKRHLDVDVEHMR